MGAFLRKCRGMLGIGVTWGIVWAGLFAAASIVIGIFDPDSIDPGEGPIGVGRLGFLLGFISGGLFGLVLSFAEGRKSIRQLSLPRAALWGALGSATFPLLAGANPSMLIIVCPVSAALAAGSIALARRGDLQSVAAGDDDDGALGARDGDSFAMLPR